ncbi:hypothetical protein [Paenibacillus sp. HJGM_3]|uniref:hypothetical protein n=1 Tax=Paenibacillus sp. HJGM_3 TaxID=3379816 RepID=UPI00385CB7C6
MSDIGLSYDATTQPSRLGVKLGLSFSNTTLRATVRDVDNFIVRLTPSGNVSEQILSGVAWPLAQFLGTILPGMTKSLINGYSFEPMSITPSSVSIEGETLTFAPQDLSLTGYNGMLLVQGSIHVT